jgi:hypothetical protein
MDRAAAAAARCAFQTAEVCRPGAPGEETWEGDGCGRTGELAIPTVLRYNSHKRSALQHYRGRGIGQVGVDSLARTAWHTEAVHVSLR